jgi:hypothetical protein
VVLLVDSSGPVPSQLTSAVTARPPFVVIVPDTAARCSEGENVNVAGPEPLSLTKLPSQSKPRRRTVRKSLSRVVSPDWDSSSCPPIAVTRVSAVEPSGQLSVTT